MQRHHFRQDQSYNIKMGVQYMQTGVIVLHSWPAIFVSSGQFV